MLPEIQKGKSRAGLAVAEQQPEHRPKWIGKRYAELFD